MCWVKSNAWEGFCPLKQLSIVGMSQALASHVFRIWCWIPTGRRLRSPPPLPGKALTRAGRMCCGRFHQSPGEHCCARKKHQPHSPACCNTCVCIRLFHGRHIKTRASVTRNVEACVLLVFLLCIISFQHTLFWQVMILAVIKPMVPSFLNGHKVKAIPRRDGRCSVQQMPMKICVHLPPHLSGKTSDR